MLFDNKYIDSFIFFSSVPFRCRCRRRLLLLHLYKLKYGLLGL